MKGSTGGDIGDGLKFFNGTDFYIKLGHICFTGTYLCLERGFVVDCPQNQFFCSFYNFQ